MASAPNTAIRWTSPTDDEYMEESSGLESPSFEANKRKIHKKDAKAKKGTRSISKPTPVATKCAPSRKKIINALENAALLLKEIGDAEDVLDWLEDNDVADTPDVQDLRRCCKEISNLLRVKTMAADTEGEAAEYLKRLDQFYVLRAPSNSVMLLAPVESLQCNRTYHKNKVLGLIRRKGEGFPLMMALPGWKCCADAHPKLLDSEIWSERVKEFAQNVDHKFWASGYDKFHNKENGDMYASHVEPKLMLFWACRLQTKRMGWKLNLRQLHYLRHIKSRTEAEILISSEPCLSCQKFKELIELVTGLKFNFKLCPNLGLLHSYKDSRGQKRYRHFTSDESEATVSSQIEEEEDEEEEQHIYPLQPRSPNIMVVVKSNAGSTRVSVSQTSLITTKKQTLPRVPKPKERRKRQYEDSEDEEDYTETPHIEDKRTIRPRTRGSTMAETGLVSPGPSPSPRTPGREEENIPNHNRYRGNIKRAKWI
jgi:hypothetical protein